MLCVSLVDLGLELTTLFEFQVFPKAPIQEMHVLKMLVYMHIICM